MTPVEPGEFRMNCPSETKPILGFIEQKKPKMKKYLTKWGF
jgi:hypothetical protein